MKKKLTQKEKKFRQELKKKWQEDGVLPPDKPRLNRKKFAAETICDFKELLSKNDIYTNHFNIVQSIYTFIPFVADNGKCKGSITAEQIGLLKVMKLTIERIKFIDAKREAGITTWTVGEGYEAYVKEIINL